MAWIISDKPAPFPWVIEDTVRDSEVAIGPVNSGWTHDEEARIARLIASAPDLLEALQELVVADDWSNKTQTVAALCEPRLWAAARAAIAKAIGK